MQEHPAGFAIWELCPTWYAHGACRSELWCSCRLSDGGPLQSIVQVDATLQEALEACDVLEAAKGGIREVPSGTACDAAAVAAFCSIDPGDVPW